MQMGGKKVLNAYVCVVRNVERVGSFKNKIKKSSGWCTTRYKCYCFVWDWPSFELARLKKERKIQEISVGRFDYFRDGFSIDNITVCFLRTTRHRSLFWSLSTTRSAAARPDCSSDTAEVYIYNLGGSIESLPLATGPAVSWDFATVACRSVLPPHIESTDSLIVKEYLYYFYNHSHYPHVIWLTCNYYCSCRWI